MLLIIIRAAFDPHFPDEALFHPTVKIMVGVIKAGTRVIVVVGKKVYPGLSGEEILLAVGMVGSSSQGGAVSFEGVCFLDLVM